MAFRKVDMTKCGVMADFLIENGKKKAFIHSCFLIPNPGLMDQ